MAKQVIGMFDTLEDAEATIRDLQAVGISNTDISFVGTDRRGETTVAGDEQAGGEHTGEVAAGAGFGAGGGAIVGGLAGLLIGMGALMIPGIGPVLAAGPFAAAIGSAGAALGAGAIGAGIGAATGSLLGALVAAGIPDEDANVYAESIRRGGTLVIARVNEPEVAQVLEIMDRNHVVDVDDRGDEYRAGGWSRYDDRTGAGEIEPEAAATAREARAGGLPARPAHRSRSYDVASDNL